MLLSKMSNVAPNAEVLDFRGGVTLLAKLADTSDISVLNAVDGFGAQKLLEYREKIRQEMSHYEKDPNGVNQHAKGAKLDAGKLRAGLVLGDFSRALRAVCAVGTFGANKYTDHGWLSVADGSNRYADAFFRHYLARMGEKRWQKIQDCCTLPTSAGTVSRN